MNQKTRGAVIVTRVSTGEQVRHGTSLESQRDACRQKALALNLPIVAEYEDAGISGAYLTKRAGMMAAIDDIQAGRADTLICANLSRYSRDVEHQQQIKKAVQNAGGRLVFSDMDFEDTPEGDLNFTIQGGFAEYERKVIRARMMRGKRKRAEEGQQPQRSRSPYGYHIVTNAEVATGLYPAETRGHYLIAEPNAAVVRRLFAGYYSGDYSLPTFCLALNREGIPTPANGRAWHESTLRAILRNPVYKGQPVSGRQKCSTDESRLGQRHKLTGHLITTPEVRTLVPEADYIILSAPPLVTGEVWEAVQERLTRGRAQNGGNPRQVQMLSGHTFCPHCGGKAGFKQQKANGKRYRYFICNGHKASRYQFGVSPCRGDLYSVETVEQAVLQAVRDAWQNPNAIAAALSVYEESAAPVAPQKRTAENAAILSALTELKAEEQATAQAQISGIRAGADPDVYAALFTDIATRRTELQSRFAETQRASAPRPAPRKHIKKVNMDAALRVLEQAWRVLNSPDVEGYVKRGLLLTLIEKVVCHKEGAEVVFLPGVFREAGKEQGGETTEATLYTTCIGMSTHR